MKREPRVGRDLYPAVGVVEGVTGDSSGKDSSGNCTLKDKCFSILKTLKV